MPPSEWRLDDHALTASRSLNLDGVRLAVRAALSAALALAIAQLARLPSPVFAMIGAVIVTDLSAAETRRVALPRLGGTLTGAAIGAALTPALIPRPLAIGAGVFAAMWLTHLLRWRTAEKLAGYTCGIVLLDQRSNPWLYGFDRLLETALGIGVAVLVSLVPPLIGTNRGKDLHE